jgi:hypothetical protein
MEVTDANRPELAGSLQRYPVAAVTNACHFPMLEIRPFLEAVQKQFSALQTAHSLPANDDRKIILKQDEANS